MQHAWTNTHVHASTQANTHNYIHIFGRTSTRSHMQPHARDHTHPVGKPRGHSTIKEFLSVVFQRHSLSSQCRMRVHESLDPIWSHVGPCDTAVGTGYRDRKMECKPLGGVVPEGAFRRCRKYPFPKNPTPKMSLARPQFRMQRYPLPMQVPYS